MLTDKYKYWPEQVNGERLVKHFCQYRGKTRHGDSALFNKDQGIIFRYTWIDGRGILADSSDGVNVTKICDYVNNRRHGHRLEFYDYKENLLKSKYSYRNDRKHGPYVTYYPGGERASIGEYFAGELHGTQTYFFQYAQDTSDVDSYDAELNEWEVNESIEYYHGRLHGARKLYDRNGYIVLFEFYEDGQPVFSSESVEINAIGLAAMSLPVVKNRASGQSDAQEQESHECPEEGNQDCPVCYTAQVDIQLQCGHCFCQNCIVKWKTNDDALTCPMCRCVLH